jgi:hypothetical protein
LNQIAEFPVTYASVEIVEDAHAEWIDTYIAENPPRRPWPWSSYDATFSFVQPPPWRETRQPG